MKREFSLPDSMPTARKALFQPLQCLFIKTSPMPALPFWDACDPLALLQGQAALLLITPTAFTKDNAPWPRTAALGGGRLTKQPQFRVEETVAGQCSLKSLAVVTIFNTYPHLQRLIATARLRMLAGDERAGVHTSLPSPGMFHDKASCSDCLYSSLSSRLCPLSATPSFFCLAASIVLATQFQSLPYFVCRFRENTFFTC